MVIELLFNAWFWGGLTVLLLSIISLFIAMSLKKSIKNVEQIIQDEDQKISKNFEKIHTNMNLVGREINQAVTISKNLAEHQAAETQVISTGRIIGGNSTPENNLTFTSLHPKKVPRRIARKYKNYDFGQSPLKYTRGKKFQKFLTPSGRIKKHYRNDLSAQECYQKFHGIK